MKTKICSKCHKGKPLVDFWKDSNKKDNHHTVCIICCKKRIRIYTNDDIIKKQNYYVKYKEKILKQRKSHYQINKIQINTRHKEYYEINKKWLNKLSLLACQKRQKIDVGLRIRLALRTRTVLALKRNWKSGHTLELLGCSIEFLKNHLESQFKDGMSWENYGRGDNGKGMKEWHVDHIYPCASFDLSKPEEQEICFHWSNLQPMWASDNRSKGNKI